MGACPHPGQRVRQLRRGGVLLLADEGAEKGHRLRGLCVGGKKMGRIREFLTVEEGGRSVGYLGVFPRHRSRAPIAERRAKGVSKAPPAKPVSHRAGLRAGPRGRVFVAVQTEYVRISAPRSARRPLNTTSVSSSSSAVLICECETQHNGRISAVRNILYFSGQQLTRISHSIRECIREYFARLARHPALEGHGALGVQVSEVLKGKERTRPETDTQICGVRYGCVHDSGAPIGG